MIIKKGSIITPYPYNIKCVIISVRMLKNDIEYTFKMNKKQYDFLLNSKDKIIKY